MPLYVYRAKSEEKSCSQCRDSFEVFQKFSEAPVETCPGCGNEVARIFHANPTIQDRSEKKILSDDNLRKHGFKKLVNRGGGKYDEVV